MGWKLVRDNVEAWCRANGVSGQWRESPQPEAALWKKIGEEYGEAVEWRDPAELYDLRDVVDALIKLLDPGGVALEAHLAKVARLGSFARFIEWTAVPEAAASRELR